MGTGIAGERPMTLTFVFLRDDEGSITLEWLEIAAGVLTLGMMTTYGVLNGGTAPSTSDMSDAVTWVNTEADTDTSPNLTIAGAFQLTERVALPVGSVAVRSNGSFTTFETPDGGWVDAFSGNGKTVPEGAMLTSLDTFTLRDGRKLTASTFSSSYREAYSSSVAYTFQ
jgi:hypothetical protein